MFRTKGRDMSQDVVLVGRKSKHPDVTFLIFAFPAMADMMITTLDGEDCSYSYSKIYSYVYSELFGVDRSGW
jgi:hypothetical protein